MKLSIGYDLEFDCPSSTPMVLMVTAHSSRAIDIITPDIIMTSPEVPITGFQDGFGNWCSRLVAPAGRLRLSTRALVHDSGEHDPVVPTARQTPVEELPHDVLQFLRGSRYCETDSLSNVAWSLFGSTAPGNGWLRVQAICDYVHEHIEFGYAHARPTKSALEAHDERAGVCRDYAHLAIAFCRCMNIPARYCTGYLSDIGIPPPYGTMDFAGWFEAYLDGQWHTFDPRNNIPRIGRVLIARGRDASDVPISYAFGTANLNLFRVIADEVNAKQPA
jgi:transglutaminase-like putative cysteine protease